MADRRSDGELVAAARRGDQEAFGELLSRHQRTVLAIAYRELGDQDAVQDAAQETFVKAYLNLGSLQHFDAFGRWVGRIAAGTARDARRRTRREVPLGDADLIADASDEADSNGELAAQVQQALDTLPALTRQAVALHYLGDRSLAEVAHLLHLTPGAVKVRLCRARERLRKEMRAMVTETVEHTVIRLFGRLRVHDSGGSICYALGGFSSPDRILEQAMYSYDLVCRALDPDAGPLWEEERRAALLSMAARVVEDGFQNHARAIRIAFPSPDQRKLDITYVTPSEEGARSTMTGGGYEELRDLLAEQGGLRGSVGRAPREGVLHHCSQGREYAIPISLSAAEATLELGKAKSSPCPPQESVVQRGTRRIARAVVTQSLLDGASEIKLALSKQDSEIDTQFRVGEEWHPLLNLRAETFLHGNDPKQPGTPTAHPLWLPLRQAFAALAGIDLRAEAARQTARFEFAVGGSSRPLRATFTPKLIRVTAS